MKEKNDKKRRIYSTNKRKEEKIITVIKEEKT
jgi:hypothetical protein